MLTASVTDISFGESYFAQGVKFNKVCVTLHNNTADVFRVKRTIVDDEQSFVLQFSLIPLELHPSTFSEDWFEVFPKQSLLVDVLAFPAMDSSLSAHYKTSYFKFSSTIRIPYAAATDEASSDEELFVKINYSVDLCTSVLFVEQLALDFPVTTVGEFVFRDCQVWNRSDCELQFKIDEYTIENANPAATDIDELGVSVLSPSASLSFEDCETDSSLLVRSLITVAPFASQRFRIGFVATVCSIFYDAYLDVCF